MRFRLLPSLLWFLLFAWLLLQVAFFMSLAERGQSPIDYLPYQRGAEAIERGKSPYLPPAQSREIFRYFHQIETELLAANARGEGRAFLNDLAARPQQPGPYVYPPTLALLVSQLNIGPQVFTGVLLLSILGFVALWFNATKAHSGWLLLVVGSRDVLATLHGGNVELMLLFFTLLAARLLWDQRGILAAPLIALVLLIKPFYALFFVAFLVLQGLSPVAGKGLAPRSIIVPGLVMLVLTTAEIYRWGSVLSAETLGFYLNASDHLWIALPVSEQSPLSAWSRTPMQGLINLEVPVPIAQTLALGLWMLFGGVTLWQARKVSLSFPMVFALALTLLYWGRPAGYGFNYLELVMASVVWPCLRGWQKPVFLAMLAGVMASRWWAFLETLRGESMSLLTLQTASFPWETWLVLPLSWLLMLRATAMHSRTSISWTELRLAQDIKQRADNSNKNQASRVPPA